MRLFSFYLIGIMMAVYFLGGCGSEGEEKKIEPPSITGVQNFKLDNEGRVAVIDSGSGGSTLYIFSQQGKTAPKVVYTGKQIAPPLSTIISKKEELKKHLEDILAPVPDEYKNKGLSLFLLATAGMRNVGDIAQEKATVVLKEEINTSPFTLGDVKIIPGATEGLYAWVAANFQNGFDKDNTKGIIEIGGASTQIAFVPSTDAPDNENIVTLKYEEGKEVKLYVYSSNNHGENRARALFDSPDCETAKAQKPNSTYPDCKTALIANMAKSVTCKNDCINWTDAAKQPAVDAKQKFMALGGLLSNVKKDFTKEDPNKSFLALLNDAGAVACKETPAEIVKVLPVKKPAFAEKACFQTGFVASLLYGDATKYKGMLPEQTAIEFNEKISWPIGFVIFHANNMSVDVAK